MKVYSLEQYCDGDETLFFGCFSSLEKAEEYIYDLFQKCKESQGPYLKPFILHTAELDNPSKEYEIPKGYFFKTWLLENSTKI